MLRSRGALGKERVFARVEMGVWIGSPDGILPIPSGAHVA
jgi:hypothetical protein